MSDPITILSKATGAGNSDDFEIHGTPATIRAYPKANLGSDTGILMQKNPDGTYDDVYDLNGTQMVLSATMPGIWVRGAGTYRVEFAARTSAVGVTMHANTRN